MGVVVLGAGLLHIAGPTLFLVRPARGLGPMVLLSVLNVLADGVLLAAALFASENDAGLVCGALVALNAGVFGVLRRPEVAAWTRGA